MKDEQVVYFTVHSEADLEVHGEDVPAHGELDWRVLTEILEDERGDTRPEFILEGCSRTVTAHFAWFFEGLSQFVREEGFYSTQS
ncbi:MAG: hypothetical protein QGG73_13185 [Candidatus Hydrogenedentes bacterium]|jgi:hypothetical protein|nr:hypothetical protein [Candidatus Hydrogenedentota bacterium]